MNFIDEGYYISLSSHEEFTKDDIVIDYQPEASAIKFSYTITKDGKKSEPVMIEGNSVIRIVFRETGQYNIEFTNYYSEDGSNFKTFKTGMYNVDKTAPVIEFKKENVEIRLGDNVDFKDYIVAEDNVSGVLTKYVTVDDSGVDLNAVGKQKVKYEVKDTAGNTTTKTLEFTVVEYSPQQEFIKQCSLIGVVIVCLFIILSYYRSITIEKRLSLYSINPKKKKATLFERIIKVVTGMIEPFADWLARFNCMEDYAERYERYQVAFHEKSALLIVAKKVVISVVFFAVSMIVVTLKLEVMTAVEMLLALLIGYYLLDFIYLFKYQFYRRNVENDLLQAIIVMKNAIRAGNSITQTIDIVTEELEGDIALEFKKMKQELTLGLSIEEVFERFAERLDLPEVNYLTSSLIILNQTGGNIVKVFSSIEKTLMNKKKIRLELRALTSSSKMVTGILILLPIVFVAIISFISPNYFLPFFESSLGIMLFIMSLAIYLLYIHLIRRIMKVRV